MRRLFYALLSVLGVAMFGFTAQAHLGSPDIFYEGMAGAYPVHVAIRMPTVVPGRAQIDVRVLDGEPAEVLLLPVFSGTAISNAPPPDAATPIVGETNLYSGQLWLMTSGAYTIQVSINGRNGEGQIEVPVNSVALSQLPLPSYLGKILAALAALLVFGGAAVVAGAARESALAKGVTPEPRDRRKGWIAGLVTLLICFLALWQGNSWWHSSEDIFTKHVRSGGWPKLTAAVQANGRILDLTLSKSGLDESSLSLAPDHEKLMHLFLVREGTTDAFAHLHPIQKEDREYQVALPPLPAGSYKIFCDLTFAETGLSSTATNTIDLPALPATSNSSSTLKPDVDDSWTTYSVPAANTDRSTYQIPNGPRVTWLAHPPLHAHRDAGLRFEIADAAGHAVPLQPYMGMISHAAVCSYDGAVFDHLHPGGNFSMGSYQFFQEKLTWKNAAQMDPNCGLIVSPANYKAGQAIDKDHSAPPSIISLPYEFPAPGKYHLWVQFKTDGQVYTAVFDTDVTS